jgi:hypothetical protein
MAKQTKKDHDALGRAVLFIEVLEFAERLGRNEVSNDPVQRELRRLVQAWFDSGKNLDRLFQSNPQLAKEARTFRAEVVASRTGRAKLSYSTDPNIPNPTSPHRIAVEDFFEFLLNPSNETLRGPCAYCRKYFANKTNRRKMVYCSAACGRRFTSRLANETQRKKEYARRLKLAKRSIMQWSTTSTKLEWNEWVFGRTRISKNWLTRAMKNGDLVEPVKRPRAKS